MKGLWNKIGLFKAKRSVLKTDSANPVELGYALALKNIDVGLDIFGSPKEIVEEIKQRGLSINEIAQLPNTTIDAQKVQQAKPVLRFHGGPFAEPMMNLLDALSVKNLKSAETILSIAPGILDENNIGASIPMIAFASTGELDIIDFLLEHESSPNLPGHLGMTPLDWAAAKGHYDVVDLLITHGGNPTVLGWFLLTPAEVGFINGHGAITKKLKDCAPEFYEPDNWMAFLQRMGIDKG